MEAQEDIFMLQAAHCITSVVLLLLLLLQTLPLMARLFGPRGGKLDDIAVVVSLVV